MFLFIAYRVGNTFYTLTNLIIKSKIHIFDLFDQYEKKNPYVIMIRLYVMHISVERFIR